MNTTLNFNISKRTGIIFYSGSNIIRKFTLNKNSFFLRNEINGFEWYVSKVKKKIFYKNLSFKTKLEKNYIDFPIFKGRKYSFWKPLKETSSYIEIIMKHYLNVWPNEKKTYYHGDLSLENVIFLRERFPLIIDWEFSKKNIIWGLDICYLLISAVLLPMLHKNNQFIKVSELLIFEKLWFDFFKGNKNNKLIKTSILEIKKIIKNNRFKIKNNFMFRVNESVINQILEVTNKNA